MPARTNLGIGDMLLALWAPRRAFARVEDVQRFAWPLVILLAAVTLIGYATVQTGLIDREVDRGVLARIAAIDQAQRDVVERTALREMYDKERQRGEFDRVLMRIAAVAAEPVSMLVSTLVIAALLFGAVALTGRKAEWNTLLAIVVYAGLIDVVGRLVRFAFMLRLSTLDVDTSLGAVVRYFAQGAAMPAQQVAAVAGLASAVDPFRIWYWLVVIIGLKVTRQLGGWRPWVWCGACWVIGALARAGAQAASAGA